MLRNYLTIALRNLRRHAGYTFINVFGLAVGLACCLLIGLFVQDELSYDRLHTKGDRLYRVNQLVMDGPTPSETWAWTGGGLGDDLADDFPSVEAMVRFIPMNGIVKYVPTGPGAAPQSFREDGIYATDAAIFAAFTFPFVHGDPATALEQPNAAVMTASTARRYFGDADAIGKTIEHQNGQTYVVRGVIEDVPAQSHLQFDILLPVAAFKQANGYPVNATFSSYWWPFGYTYVLLAGEDAAAELEEQLPAFVARHREAAEAAQYIPTLEPLHDIYLRTTATNNPGPIGSQATVNIFLAIALAILALACINFMNLSTARSTMRAREVGVRKSVGAQRGQLIAQFMSESVLTSALALLLAIGLVELMLPLFNDIAARELDVAYASNAPYWIGLLLLVVFTGLVAGSYPALYLSGFRPAQVLKGAAIRGGSARLRKGLVIVQFTVSIALVAAAAIAFSQLRYVQTARLGFDDEQLVSLRLARGTDWDVLTSQLNAQAGVVGITGANRLPGYGRGSSLPYQVGPLQPIADDDPSLGFQYVDYNYFDLLGIEIVAGRTFASDVSSDLGVAPESESYEYHVFERGLVINEATAQANGWTAEEALGQQLRLYAYENGTFYTDIRGEVVGVVKDFHHSSLRSEITPLMFMPAEMPGGLSVNVSYALIRVAPGNAADAMQTVQRVWDEVVPDAPFEASFLDQDLATLYVQEQRLGSIIGAFAGLGIVIACLGLFGLAAYAAEQRTKEIGVRKVMGASVGGLVQLLTRDFLALVLVAALIASPLAYFAMRTWLNDFAYRIDLDPLLFVGVATVALVIAFATVGYQAWRAARMNPVEALRYE